MDEARKIIEERIEELQQLSYDELSRYADKTEETQVTAPSEREYRVRVSGWVDDEEDGACARIEVRGVGLRRIQRLRATVMHLEPDQLDAMSEEARQVYAGPQEITNRWQDWLTSAAAILIVMVIVAPWFIGVGFLISLLL